MEKEENKQPAKVPITIVINITSPPFEIVDNIIPIHVPKTTTWLILRQYNDKKIRKTPKIRAILRL